MEPLRRYYHRGICLRFEVARDLTSFAAALEVKYSEDYPVLNWVSDRENSTAFLLQKYIGWKYEKERRIITPEAAGQFFDFKDAALSGIIVGCRATEKGMEQLSEMLDERARRGFSRPKLYRAVRSDEQFELTIRSLK